MVLGLVAVTMIAGALAVVCVRLAGDRSAARRELAAAKTEHRARAEALGVTGSELEAAQGQAADLDASLSALANERSTLLAERDDARQANERLTAAQERLEDDHARLREEHASVTAALAGERERAAAAERAASDAAARIDEYRALVDSAALGRPSADHEPGDDPGVDPTGPAGGGGVGDDHGSTGGSIEGGAVATWRILLASLERRWAGVVGATPDIRGVLASTVADQLVEAVAHEAERLREEVGVDVELTNLATVEPTDPVTFLLATTDLLGVLASQCERVVVTVDGALVLSGDGWVGPTDDLELARSRTVAAGVAVDAITVDGELVSLALHPRPGAAEHGAALAS